MNEQVIDALPKLDGNLKWEPKGNGFDLRRVVHTGRKCRRLYVCHLSASRWQQMRAKYPAEALPEVLRAWANGFRKGIAPGQRHVDIGSE